MFLTSALLITIDGRYWEKHYNVSCKAGRTPFLAVLINTPIWVGLVLYAGDYYDILALWLPFLFGNKAD